MSRRIIHIATTSAPITQAGQPYVYTTALCDDGTVWQLIEGEQEWTQLPVISLATAPTPVLPIRAKTIAGVDDFPYVL